MSQTKSKYRTRRITAVSAVIAAILGLILANPSSYEPAISDSSSGNSGTENNNFASSEQGNNENSGESTTVSDKYSENANPQNQLLASSVLEKLDIKGRAPKTGYSREEFYKSWPSVDGCNLRQRILKRELGDSVVLDTDKCTVISGEFDEPYTGSHLVFYEKSDLSKGLQIDHVVALSDAWQKGAQYLSKETRYEIATDPLNLLAVDSSVNQGKSDGDAATWLPPNKAFRCQYVARQVSVKYKYELWVTQAEHDAIARILNTCPNEPAVGVELRN